VFFEDVWTNLNRWLTHWTPPVSGSDSDPKGYRLSRTRQLTAGNSLRVRLTTGILQRASTLALKPGRQADHRAYNQRGEEVATCRRTALMQRRPAAGVLTPASVQYPRHLFAFDYCGNGTTFGFLAFF
jgi:hypothetical protein